MKRYSGKTSTQLAAPEVAGGSNSRRRGSLLHYIIIYMTLTSALLTLAGVCLHAILQADSSDRRESLFLNSLHRADQQLRMDSQVGLTFRSATELVGVTPAESKMVWTADRGILTRTEKQDDKVTATDRFVFPAGSLIAFEQDGSSIVVSITEPSVFVKYSPASNGGSNLNKPVAEASPPTPLHVAQPNHVEIRLKGTQS